MVLETLSTKTYGNSDDWSEFLHKMNADIFPLKCGLYCSQFAMVHKFMCQQDKNDENMNFDIVMQQLRIKCWNYHIIVPFYQ